MRIISGSARGCSLLSPKGGGVRPTADRVKEALFSMLTPYLSGSSFLDLFAGSGAIGIEALSRGAARAVFVDNSRQSLDVVRKNSVRARLEERSEIIYSDAVSFLKENRESFDIIFLDPPFNCGTVSEVMPHIQKYGILNPGGLCAVECPRMNSPSVPQFELLKEKVYGSVKIIFYRVKAEPSVY